MPSCDLQRKIREERRKAKRKVNQLGLVDIKANQGLTMKTKVQSSAVHQIEFECNGGVNCEAQAQVGSPHS